MADTLFEIRDLRKQFGNHAALRGITTELRRGEAVFLIGPSGSGKSTFLRCLNLLERPDGGSLHFCGEDLLSRRCDVNRFRMRVGMVFQHFNLFPHLTVLENITLAPVLTKRLSASAAERKALDLLARIGLADKRHAYPPQLSGGQKQRIAIVRALAMAPEVLLFDEPTSALDPEMVGEVLALMKELAGEGLSMAVVTHEIAFAREVASRILFLEQGQITAEGSPHDFFTNQANPRVRDFLAKVL